MVKKKSYYITKYVAKWTAMELVLIILTSLFLWAALFQVVLPRDWMHEYGLVPARISLTWESKSSSTQLIVWESRQLVLSLDYNDLKSKENKLGLV